MRGRVSTLAAVALVLTVAAATPLQADENVLEFRNPGIRIAQSQAGAPVASAKGGYHWTLPEDVIGFEVIGRTTANVTKFADGAVQGTWIHHQIFLDQAVMLVVDATCLGIYDGNRAKIGGVITVSNDPDLPPGLFAWFQAIDNGEGANADPDQTTFVGIGDEAENEAYCNSPDGPRFGPFDVTGNLQVWEN